MPTYKISGIFHPGGDRREFTREIEAENEDVARDHIYSDLGSKHRLKRTQIKVEDIQELEEIEQ